MNNPSFTTPTKLQAFLGSEYQLNNQAIKALKGLYTSRWNAFWNQPTTQVVRTLQGPQQQKTLIAAQSALTPAQKLAAWGSHAAVNLSLFSSLAAVIVAIETQFGTANPGSDLPGYPAGFNIVVNSETGAAILQQLVGTAWVTVTAEPLT